MSGGYVPLHERANPREVAWGKDTGLIWWHLPPEALRIFAMWLNVTAIHLRDRAGIQEADAKRQAKALKRIGALPLPDTPTMRRALREGERLARDREVMRLAHRGWSNDRIGKRLKLHPVTVSKIIGRILRPKTIGDLMTKLAPPDRSSPG
jgi:hypothetical protein